jgi:hypothetical protein
MQEDIASESARNEAVSVLLVATEQVVLNQHAFGNGIVPPWEIGTLLLWEACFPFNDTKTHKIKSHKEHRFDQCSLWFSL